MHESQEIQDTAIYIPALKPQTAVLWIWQVLHTYWSQRCGSGRSRYCPCLFLFHKRFAKQAERRSFSCCNFQFKTAHTYSLPPAAFSGLTYTMKHAAKYHSLMICILSSLCTSSMLHTSSCGCLYEGRRFSTTVTWWSCRRTQCHLITFSTWCIPWWA